MALDVGAGNEGDKKRVAATIYCATQLYPGAGFNKLHMGS